MNNNMELVQEYISNLNKETQELANTAIKDMRAEGFKWSWLLAALEIKEPEEWEKWGFGLLFNNTFRAQIEKNLNKSRKQIKERMNIWVRDEDSEEESTLSIAIPANQKGDMETLEQAISSLLSTLGLAWEDVADLADKNLGLTPAMREELDAIPDEVVSAPIEIEKDYSDAPKWFDVWDDCWKEYDVSQFTMDTSQRSFRICRDLRNVDAIKYAFEKGDIPQSNIEYFQRQLKSAESLSSYLNI